MGCIFRNPIKWNVGGNVGQKTKKANNEEKIKKAKKYLKKLKITKKAKEYKK